MDKQRKDGPAFPIKGPVMTSDEQGMTLRDYFAAHVLMGMYAGDYGYDRKIRAEVAYEMADAMLEARMKSK